MLFPLLRNTLINTVWQRISASPLAKRLLHGAFWTGVGTIIAKGATVVASLCVAQFCGKTEFGEYGMVINTASMLSSVCGMGMGTTVVKYVSQLKVREPERAGRILAMATCLTWGMAIVCGILFLMGADIIASKVLAAPQLGNLLRLAVLGVMLGIFNEVQLASLVGCEAYEERAKISVATGILQAIMLILASKFLGLVGAVLAFSLAAGISVLVTTRLLIPVWKCYGLKRRFKGMMQEWRVLVGFSLPTVLLLWLGFPVSWFTRILLARIPDGYDHLAIINAATPWGSLIMFLVTTLGTALVPVVSDIVSHGETSRALRLTWKVFWMNLILVVPFCLLVCLSSPLVLRIYGSDFSSGILAFCLLVLADGLGTVYQPMWNYLVGAGLMWTNFIIVFLTAIIQIILAWHLVVYGSDGLAAASLITIILRMAILVVLFRWYWESASVANDTGPQSSNGKLAK